MPVHSDNLELLLVQADTNTPVLDEGLPVGSAAEHERAPSEEGRDPNALGFFIVTSSAMLAKPACATPPRTWTKHALRIRFSGPGTRTPKKANAKQERSDRTHPK